MPTVTRQHGDGKEPPPQLLTIGEVAALLSKTENAIYNDRSKGVYRIVPVDAYVAFGRSVRIRADRLAEHIHNRTTPPPAAMPYLLPAAGRRAR